MRAHRLRLGISQEALAERAELHRTYVTDVERGARNLSLESISRLARALDISIDSLFCPMADRDGSGPVLKLEDSAIAILLVEDDPRHVELTVGAFTRAKVANRLKVLGDGAAALDYLLPSRPSRRRREPAPQVVLLDLHLPKVDGLQVLRTIRNHEHGKNLDVVVLTTSPRNTRLREAMRLGADAYIVKPVGFEKFSAITPKLNLHWSLKRHSSP